MRNIDRFQRLGLVLFILVIGTIFSFLSPYFLTQENLTNILVQSSVPIIAAVGMTIVIGSAGIDLSIGSILALSGIIMAWGMKSGMGVIECILFGIFSGATMGSLNGIGISILKISPFIVTLGTAGIFRAIALIFTESRPIYGMPLDFRLIGMDRWGPFPFSVLLALFVVGLGYIMIMWTRFGVHARAVGDNREAAFRMGVPVTQTLIITYALSGSTAALASVIVTARLNTAEAIAGLGIELEAIAAVVMGGTSFSGGEANIGGTLLGALIIGILGNGLTMINVPSYYQQLVIGMVFILAVLADRIRRKGVINHY